MILLEDFKPDSFYLVQFEGGTQQVIHILDVTSFRVSGLDYNDVGTHEFWSLTPYRWQRWVEGRLGGIQLLPEHKAQMLIQVWGWAVEEVQV